MRVVERIASAMATRNDDQILADIQIQSQRTDEGCPRSAEELDAQNPFITQDDGGRYFPHVRMDGRGQVSIAWPDGPEKTFKFFIPDKYLGSIEQPRSSPEIEPSVTASKPESHSNGTESDLKIVMMRIKMGDPDFPIMVRDIPNFPFSSFEALRQGVIRSQYNIYRFSFRQELDLFALVAPKTKRRVHSFGVALAFLGPIASIILAFIISPWTLLGLLTFFFGFRLAKGAYDSGIIQAAFKSEDAFCFLFYSLQIGLYDRAGSRTLDWNSLSGRG
jgi:hypothetical protein